MKNFCEWCGEAQNLHDEGEWEEHAYEQRCIEMDRAGYDPYEP